MAEKRSGQFIWEGRRDHLAAYKTVARSLDPPYWTPFHLRRWTLSAFCAVIASLAMALGVLAFFSHQNNGISNASSKDHYLWTYGPTAIFTLVAVYWNQIEYHTKQLQPWTAMRDGFQKASQSVLLDYTSTINIVRHRNALPALGLLGTVLIKLVTVLSTGLLVMQNVDVTKQNAPLTITENFGIADHSFWNNQSTSDPSEADFRPTMAVVAIAQDDLSSWLRRTSSKAYQRFVAQDESAGEVQSLRAKVDVFESVLNCESASFNAEWIRHYGLLNFNVTSVSSATCKNATPVGIPPGPMEWPWAFFSTEFRSSYDIVQCSEYAANDGSNGMRAVFYIGGLFRGAHHLVLNSTSTARNISTEAGSSPFIETGLHSNFSVLLCYPKYGVYKAPVTVNQEGQAAVTEHHPGQTLRLISGLASWDLMKAFLNSVTASEILLQAGAEKLGGGGNWTLSSTIDTGDHGYFWELMNIVAPQQNVMDWIDTELVNRTIQNVWSKWSAQLADFQLKTAAHHDVMGTVTKTQSRLVLQSVSFWLIEAGMLALIVAAVLLIVVMPKDILPRNPASLGGMATILAASEEFQESIRGAWNCSDVDLREKLDQCCYSTSIVPPKDGAQLPEFCINQKLNGAFASHSKVKAAVGISWWRPTAAFLWYQVVALTWVVLLICLLEGMYQLSIHNDGILTIANPAKYLHFTWTTLPALVMVLTAAMVGILHFATHVLQPYKALKQGSVPARIGLFKYPFAGPWASTFTGTFRDREYAVVASVASVFLASLLTIAISGLYTTEYVTATAAAVIHQRDWFAHNTTLNNTSPIQIEAVTIGNLSFPRFTYNEFVLPTLEDQTQATGKLNLQVPALRSFLNCSVFPHEDIVSVNNTWYEGKWKDIVNVVVEDRTNCLQVFNAGGRFVPFNCTSPSCGKLRKGQVQIDMTTAPYFDEGYSASFAHMPPTGYFGYLNFGLNVYSCERADCPKAVGVVGRSANHQIEEATVFTCSPFVRKVMINATFNAPKMDIDRASPPVAVSGSSESFQLTFALHPEHGDDLPSFENPMAAFVQIQLPQMSKNVFLSPFMDVLVYGSRGVPISELVGAKNVERLFSAVDHLYGVGFAQFMADYRTPLATKAQLDGTRIYKVPIGCSRASFRHAYLKACWAQS